MPLIQFNVYFNQHLCTCIIWIVYYTLALDCVAVTWLLNMHVGESSVRQKLLCRGVNALEWIHIVSSEDQKNRHRVSPRRTRWRHPVVKTSVGAHVQPSITGENTASSSTTTTATLRSGRSAVNYRANHSLNGTTSNGINFKTELRRTSAWGTTWSV